MNDTLSDKFDSNKNYYIHKMKAESYKFKIDNIVKDIESTSRISSDFAKKQLFKRMCFELTKLSKQIQNDLKSQ